MGIVDKILGVEVATKYADRAADLAKRHERLAEQRQELTWKQQRENESFESGPVKAVADHEAAILAWEAKQSEKIASDSLAALRELAPKIGDQPKTAAVAFRERWRTYLRRIADELGPDVEPNCFLLVAAFVDAGAEDALGTDAFLSNGSVAIDAANAIVALASDAVPRATECLRLLDISVDEAVHIARDEASKETAAIVREMTATAKHAGFARVIATKTQTGGMSYGGGFGVPGGIEKALGRLKELDEQRQRKPAKDPPPSPAPKPRAAAPVVEGPPPPPAMSHVDERDGIFGP